MRITRRLVPLTFVVISAACGPGTAPPVVAPKPPVIAATQKMSWILRMEDERILRVPKPPEPPAPPPAPVTAAKQKKKSVVPPPPPPAVTPDLTTLVTDADPRIRRRAALAIGRVGLPEGAAALQPVLTDTDADVRQMAAFGLGLLADKGSLPALTTALQDADPRVRGRAAEALGLIGDAGSAGTIQAATVVGEHEGPVLVVRASRDGCYVDLVVIVFALIVEKHPALDREMLAQLTHRQQRVGAHSTHRTKWPGATSFKGGMACRHTSIAYLQRAAKRQPAGGSSRRVAGSPT